VIEVCPHCRAEAVKSADLNTSWLAIDFACGSWDYFNGDEALQCGKRSEECKAATNTPVEPWRSRGDSLLGNSGQYSPWLTDASGRNVS
jgi:hypothetical protein